MTSYDLMLLLYNMDIAFADDESFVPLISYVQLRLLLDMRAGRLLSSESQVDSNVNIVS